jgi:radical SAM superfamily enzyme YgiQ (UPF0313 family)
MKTLICTTPLRPYPTTFPPIGSLSIINYLRKNGVADVEFYNIDGTRPDYSDAVDHIVRSRPGVLGISAVVSTSYAYTKQLIADVKARMPDTLVVVGGGLAASAEVLLRKAGADLCALGEGEKVMLNIVRRAATTRVAADFADIPGLMLLDRSGRLVNTGYEEPLDRAEIYDVDWNDLESTTDIGLFIFDAFDAAGAPMPWFAADPRARQPHRRGKRVACLPGAKGCVARCTFCHRWDKGIRYIPPRLIMQRMEYLMERYNVGFISFADENFGTDKRWLAELCEAIKPYDVLWHVGGMRVNCVDPDRLKMMQDAGCSAIAMGVETGSQRMLDIMEKKVRIQQNYDAIRCAEEAGISVVPEILLGMPGECLETILETSDFVSFTQTLGPNRDPLNISLNYAQALPGTPLYEFARRNGIVGPTLDDEEDYLLKVSDRNAADFLASINLTTYPDVIRMSWRRIILTRVAAAYLKKFGREHYRRVLADNPNFQPLLARKKVFGDNPVVDRGIDLMRDARAGDATVADFPSALSLALSGNLSLIALLHPTIFSRFRVLIVIHMVLVLLRQHGIVWMVRDILAAWRRSQAARKYFSYKSLRKIVDSDLPAPPADSQEMAPLRRGR